MSAKTKVSVAIPALNEARNIGRCVASVRQYFPRDLQLEILVGDHGSTDDTRAVAEGQGATVLSFQGGTVGELRNRLVAHCTGSILIFLDADTSVTADWGNNLQRVVADVQNNPEQITGSIYNVPESDNPFIAYWFAKIPRKESGYLGTGHMIISAELFQKLGGFEVSLRSGEDFDICMRAKKLGAEIVVRPELKVVHHDYPLSAGDFLRRECWHGSGDFQSLQRMLDSKVAMATLLFLVMNCTVILLLPYRPDLALVVAAGVVAMVSLFSLKKFKQLGVAGRLYNVAIYYLYFVGRTLSIFSALSVRRD